MNAELQGLATNQSVRIADLRELRRRAKEIYRDARLDLAAFQQPDGTFSTFPPPKGDKIHITTTCTALMALIAAGELDVLCPPDNSEKAVSAVFKRVVEYDWKSEGLGPDNAFSVAFVLRAAGFLVKGNKLTRDAVLQLKHGEKTLETIAKDILTTASTKGFTTAFSVGAYLPNAAIVYWYVDGIHSLGIDIGAGGWETLVRWAALEFTRQTTRVASDDDASMDPVSMAMAACLNSRLKKIMSKQDSSDELVQLLPSTTQLNSAIALLFKHQRPSGIWPKYFPMFHFLTAGANYCFTFETLEALVNEMDPAQIFGLPEVLAGLNHTVNWCTFNRLQYRTVGTEYWGWNSGGSVSTLLASKPESWATATVHWFLHKLDDALSSAIEHSLLQKYRVIKPTQPNREGWDKLADADVEVQSYPDTVKKVLEREFLNPLLAFSAEQALSSGHRRKIADRKSALLFGPPGTAKTTLVRDLAEAIGWPCVEIHPSDFLHRGLDNIYVMADEIFDDLLDLSGAVIFFDEMDALVQSRSVSLDATRQFLTTSMLPKLAQLHDEGRSAFFFATNYRTTFDEAITRPGRFDLLLFIGPPSWPEKLKHLKHIVTTSPLGRRLTRDLKPTEVDGLIENLRTSLKKWVVGGVLVENLSRFTYGEMKSFLEEQLKDAGASTSLADAVTKLDEAKFKSAVEVWATKYIILRKGEKGAALEAEKQTNYSNYLLDLSASRLQ